ncbi:MAG: hypothetical protein JWQ09_2726 [Segetibacter sp.]|nr:hypothetical protein [Segetibacter sp.]
MKKLFTVSLILFLFIGMTGCKKESEALNTATLNDYFPLQTGKTFLYRLDSTVLASFGTSLTVKSYLAKDSIESTFTDNQGRLSYRIFRLIRDTAGLKPWQFAATFVATPTQQSVEFVDNNLRFIKLHAPITEGYTWKGHSYIDTKSLNTTVAYLDEWEYEYRDQGLSYQLFNTTYDNTVTVFQQDETTPPGPFDPNNYQQRNLGTEVYAKGVGLVYKEFLHWTWQTTPPPAKYEDGSYGVKLRLISHN